MSKQFCYEICFGTSKAAYARFGEAVIKCKTKVTDSVIMGETVVANVSISLGMENEFIRLCEPWDMKYRSPTVFDHGTLIPLYASAEDETAGLKTLSGISAEKRIAEREARSIEANVRAWY
jgi:hypothetical protein